MSNTAFNREHVISLAGLFSATAFFAVGFALARRIGATLPALIVVTPLPTFLYILMIRSWMHKSGATKQQRFLAIDLLLIAGLLLVMALSMLAAATAMFHWGPLGLLP